MQKSSILESHGPSHAASLRHSELPFCTVVHGGLQTTTKFRQVNLPAAWGSVLH
jgi:hypothetical protein